MNTSDMLFYVCSNCVPQAGKIPRQWSQGDVRVKIHHLPCTGKVDTQYMMRAIESGARGVSVVACPEGKCHLAQGNYRADVRIKTAQRLLEEIGMGKERISLLHYSDDNGACLDAQIREEVDRLARSGESPLQLKIGAN